MRKKAAVDTAAFLRFASRSGAEWTFSFASPGARATATDDDSRAGWPVRWLRTTR
jgi:hypothetical protein